MAVSARIWIIGDSNADNPTHIATNCGLRHGIADASHAGYDPYASCLFVTPLSRSVVGKTMEVAITPGSGAERAFGSTRSMEKFYCNFGLNPIELASHPFFFGNLFVSQASSEPGKPHPLVLEFCRVAAAHAA